MKELMRRCDAWMTPECQEKARDAGLLALRLGAGLTMAFAHGLGKVQKFLAGGPYQWADPIGIGAGPSLFLAAGAEFFCALALAAGFMTRLASAPLAFTMAVAFFVVHAQDPFRRKELALLYLIVFATLFLVGPGRYSIDAWLKKKFCA